MKVNYDVRKASEEKKFTKLVAGGYVCQLTKVVDVPKDEYLDIEFDIVEGDFKGYAADCLDRNGFCPLHFRKYYNEKSAFYFAKFLQAIDATNKTKFYDDFMEGSLDEKKLLKKGIGIILQEELYRNKDGKDRSRFNAFEFTTAKDIRDNKFTTPDVLDSRGEEKENASPVFAEITEDGELPF